MRSRTWSSRPGPSPATVTTSRTRPPTRPGFSGFFEIYDDEDAFAAHGQSAHFQEWGFGVAIPELHERVREFFVTLD